MNYIIQIKAFYDLQPVKQLSTGQIALWHALMNINNKCAWSEWFTAASITLELNTCLSRQGLIKARNSLKQKGFIEFKSNGTKASSYKLTKLYTSQESNTTSNSVQDSIQDSVQSSVQDSVQAGIQASIPLNKHKHKLKQDILHEAETATCESVIKLILNDKSYYPVTQDQVDRWTELYPAVNIISELRAMAGWCEANNKNRKTLGGINRFINNWLKRCQDKAARVQEPTERRRTING